MSESVEKRTHQERWMEFLAWVVAIAAFASITLQVIALTDPLRIVEGVLTDIFLLVAVYISYITVVKGKD